MNGTPTHPDGRNWDRPEHGRLGLRSVTIEPGYTRFRVERIAEADDLLHRHAVTLAADIGSLAAVVARLNHATELPNGTAELHLSFAAPLPDIVDVDSRVVHWDTYAALITIETRSADDTLLGTGISTYSLRPRREGGR